MWLKIIESPNMKQQINHKRHIESNPCVFCQASWRSLYQQAVWTALSQLPFDTQKIRKMMWQMAFDEVYWLCQDTKAVIEGLIMFSRWDQKTISPQKRWVPGWSKFARFRLAHPTCLEGHSLKTFFFKFHHGRWGFSKRNVFSEATILYYLANPCK